MVVMFHVVQQTQGKQKEQLRESPLWILNGQSSLFQAVRHKHTHLCENVYATYSNNMQYVSVDVVTNIHAYER